jgi:large subunit ribosomal protein L9
MIEVILLERIERLGTMGQVVKVRPGFARNFLLPHKKALRATKANLDLFEKQRGELETKNAAARTAAQSLAEKIDNAKIVVIRQASDTGQLYGSVSSRDVSEAAKEVGHTIDRLMIQIDTPIKTLGLFPIKVKLHPEVMIKVTVNVARSPEEAVVQAQKGAAVLKAASEKAEVEAAFGVPSEEAPAAETGEETAEAKKPAKKAKKADAEVEGEEEAAEPKAKKPRAKKTAEA